MEIPEYHESMTSFTCTPETKCEHGNGWYEVVKFWIFTKRFFICTDCQRMIYLRSNHDR